jgi:hypothetical protein
MAAKKCARYAKFVVPLWGQAVHVVEAPSLAEATIEARRRWPALSLTTRDSTAADGLCIQSPEDEPIVLLPIGASIGCVAHECLHATTAMLERVGATVSVHDDEVAAYTLQAIVDAVAPWLTTRKRPAVATQTQAPQVRAEVAVKPSPPVVPVAE